MKISKIILYDEPSVSEIQITKLSKFIQNIFSIPVEIRKNIFSRVQEDTFYEIASCRINNTKKPFEKHIPTNDEITFEKNHISNVPKLDTIVMYDGFEIKNVILKLIPQNELNSNVLHIVFTHKLTCTFDNNDYRYHGRAVICSNPSIISTTGIIEAPAKPKAYYMELISTMAQGLNVEWLKKKYKGSYLEYHDQRLSKIVEGYLMQSIFFYLTGEAFCDTLECRLNNAHWQKDLLYSQLEISKLCEKHQKILDDL